MLTASPKSQDDREDINSTAMSSSLITPDHLTHLIEKPRAVIIGGEVIIIHRAMELALSDLVIEDGARQEPRDSRVEDP